MAPNQIQKSNDYQDEKVFTKSHHLFRFSINDHSFFNSLAPLFEKFTSTSYSEIGFDI